MIIFDTPTELDLLALRTQGLSVKTTESPIGRFGTGLKYAMAVLLAQGCEVRINTGLIRLTVEKERREFRGQPFDFVIARPENEPAFDLGFTTLLGQDWELWQAFRELHSNTADEAGETRRDMRAPTPRAGQTAICVIGAAFEAVYDDRASVIIPGDAKPLWKSDDVAIYPGPSDYVFYRGIRALELEKPSVHRYSILTSMELTEDRTIKNAFMADYHIRNAIAACDAEEVVRKALTTDDDHMERGQRYMETSKQSAAFARVVTEEEAKKSGSVPQSARLAVAKSVTAIQPATGKPNLTAQQTDALQEATERLKSAGIEITRRPLIFAGMLAGDAVVSAVGNKVYLSDKAFEDVPTLVAAIIEGFSELEYPFEGSWLRKRLADAVNKIGDMKKEQDN